MYAISNQHKEMIVALLGELERFPDGDIKTANTKRQARIIIKKLKNKKVWQRK